MEYRTFVIFNQHDTGNPEFREIQVQLDDGDVSAEVQFVTELDWDGQDQPGEVICAGIEVHPGLEYGWAVHSRQTRDQLLENIRDEQLGELTGDIPRTSSVAPDSVVRERSQGMPDVQA